MGTQCLLLLPFFLLSAFVTRPFTVHTHLLPFMGAHSMFCEVLGSCMNQFVPGTCLRC